MIWIHFCKGVLDAGVSSKLLNETRFAQLRQGKPLIFPVVDIDNLKISVDVGITPGLSSTLSSDMHIWEWDDELHAKDGQMVPFWDVAPSHVHQSICATCVHRALRESIK